MDQYLQVNQMYWNGSKFQFIFYLSIIFILIFERRKSYKILFGIFPLAMILGMYNPLTSKIVELLFVRPNLYYVRLFSVIPVFYCIAHGLILILDKLHGTIKLLCTVVAIALIISTGHSIYCESWMQHAENVEKCPDEIFAVLEAMPHERKNLRIAFPDPLFIYARQVDGNVLMPYGRRLSGDPIELLEKIRDPARDVQSVMTIAGNDSVDYIVIKKSDEAIAAFQEYGYKPYKETDNYCIFKVQGVNKKEVTLNDKRQIITSTICDSDGNPTYATSRVITTVVYEYDRWGNPIQEMYYDKDGNSEASIDGYYGIRKHYRLNGLSWLVDSITYLDRFTKPMMVCGRYETRYQYDKKKQVIKESYYDENGKPMIRSDEGYHALMKEYDDQGRVISEEYVGVDGKRTISRAGYARSTRKYYGSTNRISEVQCYDISNQAIDNSDGFAIWNTDYDDYGNVIEEVFLDKDQRVVDVKGKIDTFSDLLNGIVKNSITDSDGISYTWNNDGSCTAAGEAKGISWYSLLEGDRPFFLFPGEKYKVQYSSENVYLRIYFYEDSTWKNRINELTTLEDTVFTVPQNCGAIIMRMWVSPGSVIDETVNPKLYACL